MKISLTSSLRLINFRLFLIITFLHLTFDIYHWSFALTWQEALSAADKNSYILKSAVKQTEAAKWSYFKSFSSFLPQLSGSLSVGETISGTLGAATQSTAYGLTATQPLFAGFDNYFDNLSAKVNYDYYLASRRQIESDLYQEVRQSFIDLAIADENIELLKSIFKRRKNNSDMVELLYKSGREDKGAQLRTEADLADAQYNINAAERSRNLARLKLNQLISIEADKIEDNLEAKPPARADYDSLLINSPSYITSLKQLKKTDIANQQTISGFLPSVSLSGSYRKSGSEWPPSSSGKSWSLNVSYPFFPGGGNLADKVIYSAQYDKAKEDFIKAKNDLRYAIESAHSQFKDAIEAERIAKLYEAALALRAEIARNKYLNGLIRYDEWDRIENDYINAQKSLLAKKKVVLLAEAAWHNSYGGYVK